MKAGRQYPPVGAELSEAVMSEAWRVFLPSRYKFAGVYECRGTRLIESRLLSHGIVILLTAVVRDHGLTRITLLSREAVVRSKNRDKFIYFIVRVRVSEDLLTV